MGPAPLPRAPQPTIPRAPKRGGAGLSLGVIALLFIGGGILSLFVVLGVGDIGPVDAVAAGLLLIGVGMIFGTWRGNARPLIALGLPLVALLLLAGIIDAPLDAGGGDRTQVIDTAAEMRGDHQLTAGTLTLDLRDLPVAARSRTALPGLDAEVAFGKLVVIVPREANVAVDADVGIGDIVGDTGDPGSDGDDGIDVHSRFDLEGKEGNEQLVLDLHVGIGEIEVRRA